MNNTPTKAYALVQKDVFEEQMSDGGVYREQKAPMVPLFGRLRDTVCTLICVNNPLLFACASFQLDVTKNCGALLNSENEKKDRWAHATMAHEFLVLEVDVSALEDCNFTKDPDGRMDHWVCSAIKKESVLHEYKVITAAAEGTVRPHFDAVSRESKCPFPFIYAHDPAQAWKQHPRKTVVTVIALAVLYYCTGKWLRTAALKGIAQGVEPNKC